MGQDRHLGSFVFGGNANADVDKTAVTVIQGGKCRHAATPVKIGEYTVWAGSEYAITKENLSEIDWVVTLNGNLPGGSYLQPLTIIDCEMQDYNAPKAEMWRVLVEYFADVVKTGKRVLFFCTGGHGRTGTMLASLIAFLEPEIDDPIAAIRERYCDNAVESLAQRKAIYEILGRDLPEKYAVVASTAGWARKDCDHVCPQCQTAWKHSINATATACEFPEKDRDLCTKCFSKVRAQTWNPSTGTSTGGTRVCAHVCPCGENWSHDIAQNAAECSFAKEDRDLCVVCFQTGMKKKSAVVGTDPTAQIVDEDWPDQDGVICHHTCPCGVRWSHLQSVDNKSCIFPLANRDLCSKCLTPEYCNGGSMKRCEHECPECSLRWTHWIAADESCAEDVFCSSACEQKQKVPKLIVN